MVHPLDVDGGFPRSDRPARLMLPIRGEYVHAIEINDVRLQRRGLTVDAAVLEQPADARILSHRVDAQRHAVKLAQDSLGLGFGDEATLGAESVAQLSKRIILNGKRVGGQRQSTKPAEAQPLMAMHPAERAPPRA